MKKNWVLGSVLGMSLLFGFASKANAAEMQRLYNPNSGEHFYTKNMVEKNVLIKAGWLYEGVGWDAPDSGQPVYRVYNRNSGDHHYTMNGNEKNLLVSKGWSYEGIGWYSDVNKTVPLYRAYNPNAQAGSHNYTTNQAEQTSLVRTGWKNEGVGWYATKVGYSVSGFVGLWGIPNSDGIFSIDKYMMISKTDTKAVYRRKLQNIRVFEEDGYLNLTSQNYQGNLFHLRLAKDGKSLQVIDGKYNYTYKLMARDTVENYFNLPIEDILEL
ncbi:hypothetical protein [uncultured Enterococcus sp.]|uniref:hypothetical protein n=1 Tax=uncultured Enterococcus sp. TaxID=167972 RepID=UPI0025FDBEE5|nr:hypothetical protein [uncultured Enterococcus sp.]